VGGGGSEGKRIPCRLETELATKVQEAGLVAEKAEDIPTE